MTMYNISRIIGYGTAGLLLLLLYPLISGGWLLVVGILVAIIGFFNYVEGREFSNR